MWATHTANVVYNTCIYILSMCCVNNCNGLTFLLKCVAIVQTANKQTTELCVISLCDTHKNSCHLLHKELGYMKEQKMEEMF